MAMKCKNTVRFHYQYAYYYPIIPISFFKDLYRYLKQFYVPLPNSTSYIYIFVKRLKNIFFFGQNREKCRKIDEIEKNRK